MTSLQAPAATRCDLFCRVIDNYGDIGVCWRLARQLQHEYGWRVRLWVDDLHVLRQLLKDGDTEGIDVRVWSPHFPEVVPGDVVIEAFACEIPESFQETMARQADKPVWLNLEYLSVEGWAREFHAQPSPHPRLPLLKHFFVPGILPGTGGVLREKDLLERRARFDVNQARQAYPAETDALWVSLFCYENPVLPDLLATWVIGDRPINCLVAAGKPAMQVAACLGTELTPGKPPHIGRLTLHALPFVPQEAFDALLWMCDLNFVRGEDSFVRAQWAALPFIWHIYPQSGAAHHVKLDAFNKRYCQGLSPSGTTALTSFSAVWNGQIEPTPEATSTAWGQLLSALPTLRAHAQDWQKELAGLGNLAENLAIFCKNR